MRSTCFSSSWQGTAQPFPYPCLYLITHTQKVVKTVQNSCNRYILQKAVISGNHVELYKYSMPILCEFEKQTNPKVTKAQEAGEKREDNLSRARQTVRRLIWCNLTPHTKFLTLTCKDTCTDVKAFQRKMQTFFQAMTRKGYKLRYLYVLERQKKRGVKEGNSGTWHAHVVVFNDEKIPLEVLKSCWKHGRTEIKMLNGLRVKDDEKINDVGAYVCKYITKEAALEFGMQCFRCSNGLHRPYEVNLKADGLPGVGYFVDKEDAYNVLVAELFEKSKFCYQDSKIIPLKYDTDNYQIIEYSQAIFK